MENKEEVMNRVGEFEKVSYEQFAKAVSETVNDSFDEQEMKWLYDNIVLPKRSTSGSAGYDFVSPVTFELKPGKSVTIPTGVRVKIEDGWWLGCLPRSGMGFKYRIQLDNTMAVIDSDYYNSENEGHIFLKVTNDNRQGKTLTAFVGDRVAQGIFLPYGITYSDNIQEERNGGFGSTGK
jgi:dUTP pyrophosphatase